MKVLFLVDLHGRRPRIPEGVDLVLLGGDLTHFGEAARLQELLGGVTQPVHAVAGNCDRPSVLAALGERDLELHPVSCQGVRIAGLGAGLPFGNTPYERTEAEFEAALARLMPCDILVSHQPPYGTACDRARRVGHVGSHAVRSFIQRTRPRLVLCGHIHESVGDDMLGSTRVINPGPSAQNHGVLLRLERGEIRELELF